MFDIPSNYLENLKKRSRPLKITNERQDIIQQFVQFEKLKQPVLLMGRAVGQEKYFVTAYPSNFWIDQQGKVVHKEVGFSPESVSGMEARVEKMLAVANGAVLESLVK